MYKGCPLLTFNTQCGRIVWLANVKTTTLSCCECLRSALVSALLLIFIDRWHVNCTHRYFWFHSKTKQSTMANRKLEILKFLIWQNKDSGFRLAKSGQMETTILSVCNKRGEMELSRRNATSFRVSRKSCEINDRNIFETRLCTKMWKVLWNIQVMKSSHW